MSETDPTESSGAAAEPSGGVGRVVRHRGRESQPPEAPNLPDTTSAAGEGATPSPTTKKPRARRTRTVISWILIVLASLLIPISVMSAWAIRTVTNTDQYVATMAPLARNQVIVDHLADRATDALFSTKIVQNKVEEVLPKKAKPIVTPIVAEVKTYVHGLALKIFESPKFGQLWDAPQPAHARSPRLRPRG